MGTESPPRDQTILVTGGAGFIGSHLVEAFDPDNDVRVLDDGSTGDLDDLPADVSLVEADVRDAEAVEAAVSGVDLVYHLAAVVSVDASIADPRRSHSINVGGTLTVLDAAREAGARVVATSSAAIYGEPADLPISEDAPAAPRSPYGVDKLAADHYTRRYHDLHDLDTVVLRPFNVYGPGQSGEYAGVISTFNRQANAGDPITVHGDGAQTRDFVHVEDVVDAFRLAGTTDHVGEAFNIGTGEAISIRELAETVRDVADSQSDIVHVDPRSGDIEWSQADISRAVDRLGYEPNVDLHTGLRSILSEGE